MNNLFGIHVAGNGTPFTPLAHPLGSNDAFAWCRANYVAAERGTLSTKYRADPRSSCQGAALLELQERAKGGQGKVFKKLCRLHTTGKSAEAQRLLLTWRDAAAKEAKEKAGKD